MEETYLFLKNGYGILGLDVEAKVAVPGPDTDDLEPCNCGLNTKKIPYHRGSRSNICTG